MKSPFSSVNSEVEVQSIRKKTSKKLKDMKRRFIFTQVILKPAKKWISTSKATRPVRKNPCHQREPN